MNLKRIKLKNFRGYSQETIFDVDDLNVIIGKNDIGKSTILEALDIYFNGKPEKEDLCIDHDVRAIEISCIFDNLPSEIILDDTITTTLAEEFLLNSEGLLEIKKIYPLTATGAISEESFIICQYPDNENLSDLLSKKRTTLKLQFEELVIDPEGVNRNQSKDLRKAIRRHFQPQNGFELITKSLKIDGKLDNEDNRKKIWTSIKKFLPLYSLFFVDKPLNDQDTDIQDPMKEIIKEVLNRENILPLLEELKNAVQEASTNLADRTIVKLNELDSDLAETLKSSFPKEPSWNSIFKLTLEDERGIPLNKRGSGMRRLVLLSFFRAQIENRRTAESPNIIYALEEPETSQHPNFQLMIVNALKELSETDNAQVFFTTHNSNLAKEIPNKSLRYIFRDNAGICRIENGSHIDGSDNELIIDKIIETLGALPDPKNKVKVLIFVEGENDINGLINFSKLLHNEDQTIINLENNEKVAFIPTGGSQLKFYIEKKYLDGLLQKQIHIYDSDIPDYIQSVANLNAEANPHKIGFNTVKLELENYLHHEAIIDCYAEERIPINLSEILDTDDVPKKVAMAVHMSQGTTTWDLMHSDPIRNEEKQKKKVSQAKKNLNKRAIEKMTIDRLRERNGYDEIKNWLTKIKEYTQ
ncbi:ATP-binding protein [Epilithonimonas sp. JDS]|uniref:ATP-binding protein n=1 Tax=Epilithonimonas sp. JDS TaxID=2902797 RepID=UPI001E299878|nr:ATP-binding protein [Epilithonimonas sp. JDS]MCD9854708.1 ATP-binding protein [Epilithonimonas sp. JDS]